MKKIMSMVFVFTAFAEELLIFLSTTSLGDTFAWVYTAQRLSLFAVVVAIIAFVINMSNEEVEEVQEGQEVQEVPKEIIFKFVIKKETENKGE